MLTFILGSIKGFSQFRCSYSLIGNPVKIGDGPAAVTQPFSLYETFEKGTFLALFATVPTSRDGKAAKKARKSEDLPELRA